MAAVTCPICKGPKTYSERYPLALCHVHEDECIDSEGRKVTFGNEGWYGGFVSRHFIADSGELALVAKDGHCTVRGIKCFAQEARFGGIVIQTI